MRFQMIIQRRITMYNNYPTTSVIPIDNFDPKTTQNLRTAISISVINFGEYLLSEPRSLPRPR